jgi:UDP-N-acetylmuramoyl-tripeptide--D-alanyl-D-alanine ligase
MAGSFRGLLYVSTDAAAATETVREIVRPGDTVLVKGSRGVGLEVVAQGLAAGE